MDPISALSLACNVIDLVGTAINCGLTVKQIYDSVDGRLKAHKVVQGETDRMKIVVNRLRENQSRIKVFTNDDEIQKITSRCVKLSEDLQTVLDKCRAKHKTIWSAGKATVMSVLKSGEIDDLQKDLETCRKDLNSLIAIATR